MSRNPPGHLIGAFHGKFVSGRRTQVLSEHLAAMLPQGARVLDVGCGDGMIDVLIKERRKDVSIVGIDPLVRPGAHIPVQSFDGTHIPHADRSFDAVMFVDVLHHTEDPRILLKEAARVGRSVLIKDHFRDGLFADSTLRLMDWAGNARYGVALPYNYWPKSQWLKAFDEIRLRVGEIREELQLYPAPLSWFFERRLHFVALCISGSA